MVRFGGLVIHNIGQLLPVQIHSGCFNTNDYVYPVCHLWLCVADFLSLLFSIHNRCYFSVSNHVVIMFLRADVGEIL